MVDLRGFGGSSGCLDWVGPGEQADVKSAVEWAASQPWSTGKVGMYGKSYDGVTGLVGIAQQPKGLAAVVSQEPVYDLYRYLYMNRVRFENSLATPALYDAIAGTPGAAGDSIAYQTNALNDTSRPACPALNWADQQDSNHSSPYWQQRDLISATRGKKTPLFLTQGFIENNTKPDGAYDLWNGIAGPKRAWFGMWDHVRGNDTDENGRLLMGRAGWFDEVMRWYDYYLKGQGKNPTSVDPPIAVESSNGKWRSEKSWPPADSVTYKANLKPGTYTDDAQNNGTADSARRHRRGHLDVLAAVHRARPASPACRESRSRSTRCCRTRTSRPTSTTSTPQNNATLISRGTFLLGGTGTSSFDLYGDDWVIPAGHRIGVLVSLVQRRVVDATRRRFQDVQLYNGTITLPFLKCKRTATIQGAPSVKLEDYLANAPFAVDAGHGDGQHRPGVPAAARGGELHAVEVHSLTGTGRRDAR